MSDCRVYVLTPFRGGPTWNVDGCHGVDDDLSDTYRILNQIGSPDTFLKLTLDEKGFPSVEDVTEEAKGAGTVPCIFPECQIAGPHAPGQACWS